jgi:chromosomal replication initiator protein
MLCARIAQRLANSVGEKRYSMWFDRTAKLQYQPEHHRLDVVVPNRFVAEWITRHFEPDLRRAACSEAGAAVDLCVQIDPSHFVGGGSMPALESVAATPDFTAAPATALAATSSATALAEMPRRLAPTSAPSAFASAASAEPAPRLRHRLDDFIVGPSNELAYAAARRLIDDQQGANHPLFIHGGCGVGKTHLLQGICRQLLDQNPQAKVHYTTGEQFTNEFLTAVRSNKIDVFRRRIRRLDLLAVDDVHFIANKQATQQEFLHSFDAIELGGARVVLASDSHPRQIHQFSEALISRCVRGLVVQVHQPDTITRARIVRALAQRRQIPLMDTVIEVIAQRCAGSVRDIEGALTKLHAMSHLSAAMATPNHGSDAATGVLTPSRTIGHLLVEKVFDQDHARAPRRAVTLNAILDTVCEQVGVSREQVLANGRHRDVVLARALVVHLARQMTSMSFPEIAAGMRRTSHSTTITAAQRIARQIQDNEPVQVPALGQAMPLPELVERIRRAVTRG